jgi:surface carbohydrate biosynthesis protein
MTILPTLIIPVENQVRELDPKLLLACVAARRGFTSILGPHREIDFRIASLPRGLYLNKSMTARNLKMFQIMRRLGIPILTWDEEALVHLPPDIYYSRRLSPVAIRFLSHLFAWGEDNAELWHRYPHFPPNLPIHITGNPRNDLMRPELRSYYEEDVRSLRDRYGDFFLINTNFNHVNAFYPSQNLFQPLNHTAEEPKFGKAGIGMPRDYALGLRDHKLSVFRSFQELIPKLSQAFPELSIIIRPHPTEGHDVYLKIASGNPRIQVTNEGNVVPWLLAAKALIHNGCTTGVEAFVVGTPAISYRAVINEAYDSGFYLLPNRLSHQCFDQNQLKEMLWQILDGKMGQPDGVDRLSFVQRYLAALDGPLACERMVAVLEQISTQAPPPPVPPLSTRLFGMAVANGRFLVKRFKSLFPGTHAPPEYHRHRYPRVTLEELRNRIGRFKTALRDETPIIAETLTNEIFRIRRG